MRGDDTHLHQISEYLYESIRDSFLNISPDLVSIITLGNENAINGGLMLVGIFTVVGVVGALFSLLPAAFRSAVLNGVGWSLGIGLMSEILIGILSRVMRTCIH